VRRDSKVNPFEAKAIARRKYAERQIDKWVKWSWEIRGKIPYSKIIKFHEEYKIECYGWRRE
jgi:plasmid rolling circle replication initiator protein Rep